MGKFGVLAVASMVGFCLFGSMPGRAIAVTANPNGCAAIQSGALLNYIPLSANLKVGDKITFQSSNTDRLSISGPVGNPFLGLPGDTYPLGYSGYLNPYTYTVTVAGNYSIVAYGYPLTATCVSPTKNNIQTSAAQTEGSNSQHVMNDMLDGIIDGSLNSSFQPISGNENGVQFMAAPDIKVQPTADAPHALESDSPWRMWMAGRYTHASGSETGNQFNGLFGTSYRLSDHSTLGLFGGYEGFNYTDAAPAQFSGNGYTIGGFAAGSFSERLKLDARAYTTFLNYNIVSGGANGSTTATRFGSSVTASYDLLQGPTTLTSFLRGSGLFEWQSAYTDSLAAVHAAQNLSQGSLAPGLKLSHHAVLGNGDSFTPYAAAEANWIFGNTTLAGFSGTQGISGKVSAGAQWSNAHGTTLGLNASYGGIG